MPCVGTATGKADGCAGNATLSWKTVAMESRPTPRAWLLMAAGDIRGHGGNACYDDQIDAYSWGSRVPNHKKLQVGDPIALLGQGEAARRLGH